MRARAHGFYIGVGVCVCMCLSVRTERGSHDCGCHCVRYNPEMRVVDPICTLVFALIVLCTTFNAVRSQVHILMEGAPRNAGVIREKLMAMPTIVGIHCFHCWTLTSGKIALSAHLLTVIHAVTVAGGVGCLCLDFCFLDSLLPACTCRARVGTMHSTGAFPHAVRLLLYQTNTNSGILKTAKVAYSGVVAIAMKQ
eukprot:jgi/Bigna1/84107/fgenesh1_pg.123_\